MIVYKYLSVSLRVCFVGSTSVFRICLFVYVHSILFVLFVYLCLFTLCSVRLRVLSLHACVRHVFVRAYNYVLIVSVGYAICTQSHLLSLTQSTYRQCPMP